MPYCSRSATIQRTHPLDVPLQVAASSLQQQNFQNPHYRAKERPPGCAHTPNPLKFQNLKPNYQYIRKPESRRRSRSERRLRRRRPLSSLAPLLLLFLFLLLLLLLALLFPLPLLLILCVGWRRRRRRRMLLLLLLLLGFLLLVPQTV